MPHSSEPSASSATTLWQTRFETDGYAMLPGRLAALELAALTRAVAQLSARLNTGRQGGIRNLFDELPAVRALAAMPACKELVTAVLGPTCGAVRAILFDKTPGANWKVTWHQDLTIAVRARHAVPGFGSWSMKSGIPHVQPPAAVLAQMLTLRLHLDPCGPANGPVRVLPGSHHAGRLSAEAIAQWRAQQPEVSCLADQGDILLMRPLLLHASSLATAPAHRRVIHLEYAAGELPAPLQWYERW